MIHDNTERTGTEHTGVIADTDEMGREVKDNFTEEDFANLLPNRKGKSAEDNTKSRLMELAQRDATQT